MDRFENMQVAIDVMTAWADDPEGTKKSVGERVAEYVEESPEGEAGVLMGLVGLAGYLLVRLEDRTGETMQSHLQDIALRVANKRNQDPPSDE